MSTSSAASRVSPLLGANLGLVATVLVWGTPIPLLDDILTRWDPVGMAMLRYALSVPFLLLFLWLMQPTVYRPGRFLPAGIGWGRLIFLGALGPGGFALCFMVALAYSNPITMAILAAISPVIAGLVDWACYGQRPAKGIGLALLLAISGGIMASVELSELASGLAVEGGEPIMLIALICWAWYSITAQRWMPGATQLHITTVSMLPTGFVIAGVYLAALALGWAEPLPADPRLDDMVLIAWIAVSSIVLGVLTWNMGVKRLGVVVASMYLNLIPLVAVLTAVALGVEPRIEQLIGGLLVVAGVLQAQYRRLAKSKAASEKSA